MTLNSALPDVPACEDVLYEIHVKGALDPSWSKLMDGMTLEVVDSGHRSRTVLRIRVQDQAALAGLLDSLFRLNATVLSVEALDAEV